jgi:sphingomyelin phosphodiesterase 4
MFALSDAFDFYMFHFCIHGMKNLHKVSQAALNVNNENSKTVYFNLAADYLCNFLPSDPNSVIYPQIECSPHHLPPPATMQMPANMNPAKPTKYLMLSALSHQIQSPAVAATTRSEMRMPTNSNWRSESVMMIFVDCWLRYDIEEWELPGNEFIRLVRILVKQLHFFGNVAESDMSSLSVLRHQAQPLLNLRIYPFLKTIMARWPLDTSFLNVLELWLSYIQPWRYIYNRNIMNLNNEMVEIPERFRIFIAENLATYTQLFVRLIPRFLKMDLGLSKNAFMLFRMIKVFRQPNEIIRDIEKHMMNNNSTTTVIRSNESSMHSLPRSPNSFNRSGGSHHRSHNQSAIEDSNYVFMFCEDITMQVYELMQRLYVAKLKTDEDVQNMEKELQKHTSMWEKLMQFIGWFSSLNLSFTMALEEKKKSGVYHEFCLNILSPAFGISIEDVTREFSRHEKFQEDSDDEHVTMSSGSEFLNITPSFMKQQFQNISYTGDPALLPIMDCEVRFLVRFLHQISCKLNEMVRTPNFDHS